MRRMAIVAAAAAVDATSPRLRRLQRRLLRALRHHDLQAQSAQHEGSGQAPGLTVMYPAALTSLGHVIMVGGLCGHTLGLLF